MDSDQDQKSDQSKSLVTGVDLAEDLLKTTTQARPDIDEESIGASASISGQESISDMLESAKILAGEGLMEDAKKILRKILFRDPQNVTAKQRLETIHDAEVKQLLNANAELTSDNIKGAKQIYPASREELEFLLKGLEADLSLETESDQLKELFSSEQDLIRYQMSLEVELQGCTSRDRLDLGIAFAEMGLLDVAIGQVRIAALDPDLEFSAIALIAQWLYEKDRAYDALSEIEPILSSADYQPHEKIPYYYLAAISNLRLGRKAQAIARFKLISDLEPEYRDVAERLKELST